MDGALGGTGLIAWDLGPSSEALTVHLKCGTVGLCGCMRRAVCSPRLFRTAERRVWIGESTALDVA